MVRSLKEPLSVVDSVSIVRIYVFEVVLKHFIGTGKEVTSVENVLQVVDHHPVSSFPLLSLQRDLTRQLLTSHASPSGRLDCGRRSV